MDEQSCLRRKKMVLNFTQPRTMFFAEFMLFSSINSRFNSIFFIEVGLSTAEIGVILAIYSIFAIFAGPFGRSWQTK